MKSQIDFSICQYFMEGPKQNWKRRPAANPSHHLCLQLCDSLQRVSRLWSWMPSRPAYSKFTDGLLPSQHFHPTLWYVGNRAWVPWSC